MSLRRVRGLPRRVEHDWAEFCRYQRRKGDFPLLFKDASAAEKNYLKIEKEWAVRNGVPNLSLHSVFVKISGKYMIPHRSEHGVILVPDGLLRFNNMIFRERSGTHYVRCLRSSMDFERAEHTLGKVLDVELFKRLVYVHHIEPSYPTRDYSFLFGQQRAEPVSDDPEVLMRRKGHLLFPREDKPIGAYHTISEVVSLYRSLTVE